MLWPKSIFAFLSRCTTTLQRPTTEPYSMQFVSKKEWSIIFKCWIVLKVLEIEAINLFHSPCSALIRFLRLSGQKAMNSHICCTCCSRVSFGSLLYRHSPAQAVTNRGQTTSITAPLTGRTGFYAFHQRRVGFIRSHLEIF